MMLNQVITAVKKFNSMNITITGGEPLSQKNTTDLVDILISHSYNVSIETSNAVSIKGINDLAVIVLDIKTPDSDESEKNIIDNYNYLKKEDQIKFVNCTVDDYETHLVFEEIHNAQRALKSVESVELLLKMEDYVEENFNSKFNWSDNSAMSETRSVLRTINSLAEHIVELSSKK